MIRKPGDGAWESLVKERMQGNQAETTIPGWRGKIGRPEIQDAKVAKEGGGGREKEIRRRFPMSQPSSSLSDLGDLGVLAVQSLLFLDPSGTCPRAAPRLKLRVCISPAHIPRTIEV